MHRGLFRTVTLFTKHNYSSSFYAWMGSRMRHMCTNVDQYIYREGDAINNIYFLYKGLAGFALPRHKSYYIIIEEGETFGVVDIIYDQLWP